MMSALAAKTSRDLALTLEEGPGGQLAGPVHGPAVIVRPPGGREYVDVVGVQAQGAGLGGGGEGAQRDQIFKMPRKMAVFLYQPIPS